jgi:hypothetical protein
LERTQGLPDIPSGVEFLKRRYARAIEGGDHRTATRLRAEIDRLINGPPASRMLPGHIIDVGSLWSARAARLRSASEYDDILGPHL